MKHATISQAENGMYTGEIKNEYGTVDAGITAKTAAEVHKWAAEHGCDDLMLTKY